MEDYHQAGAPFFLWASFPDPHPPYLVPAPWDEYYDPATLTIPEGHPEEHLQNPPHFAMTQLAAPDFSAWEESGYRVQGMSGSHRLTDGDRRRLVATYYGMISLLDRHIGSILDKIDALGIAEDTVVVFTTDHGHFFGQHGLQAKGPFHYEDLLRVPFLVRWPGKVPAGRVTSAIQSHVDMTPTILEIAGAQAPREVTGISQVPVWLGSQEPVRTHAICEFHHEPTTVNLRSYIDSRHKITVYQGQTYGELFDLERDPGETNNLWDVPEHAALKSDLLLRYIWAELEKEPMWMPRVALA
jgi:uncharacterized sulfatase